jgi:hypothetical protein
LAAAHAASTGRGPARAPGDLAELLGVDVDELAGAFALVAHDRTAGRCSPYSPARPCSRKRLRQCPTAGIESPTSRAISVFERRLGQPADPEVQAFERWERRFQP